MKAKLLKKVRKHFVIERVDELASNASKTKIEFAKEYGLPFFECYDITDSWTGRDGLTKTKEDAVEIIRQWIRGDFYEKFKHKPEKKEKVWYNNKSK